MKTFKMPIKYFVYMIVLRLEKYLNLDLCSTVAWNYFILLLAGSFQVCHIAEKRMIRIFFCSEIWSEPLRQSSKCIKSNKWTCSVQLKRSIYQFEVVKLCLWFHLTLSNPFLYPFSFSFTLILSAMDHWSNNVITQV